MAKAYTQEVSRPLPPYKPITLVVETAREAYALEQLLGEATGDALYAVFNAYDEEYNKQEEVINNAVS